MHRIESGYRARIGHDHEEHNHMSQRTRRDRRGWGKICRLPSGRWQASYIGRDNHRHTAGDVLDPAGR